jgi:glyoxylase-like metal-dependent hydrolase (beta-lactamase superfamily II)
VAAVRAAERERGVRLEAVWLTHAHLDHIGALAEVVAAFGVPVHLHPLDRPGVRLRAARRGDVRPAVVAAARARTASSRRATSSRSARSGSR